MTILVLWHTFLEPAARNSHELINTITILSVVLAPEVQSGQSTIDGTDVFDPFTHLI